MEPTLMLRTSVALLTITALGGLVLAWARFGQKRQPPTWLAMLHGFLAAAAVTLLAYAAFTVGVPTLAWIGLLLFALAAAGGVVLNLGYHWKQVELPAGLVAGHAVAAVAGYLALLVVVFR